MKFILIVLMLLLYGGLGASLLKLAGIPVRKSTLVTFVVSGCVTAGVAFITFGVLIAEEFGLLGEGDKVISVFILSAIASVLVSFFSARFIARTSI
ncbi:MAG TPA: hypothetical protein ENK35_08795 [Candidatus Tenderia sp.]|nr:hypothetical protein [Candidatus Tenderia sp.]